MERKVAPRWYVVSTLIIFIVTLILDVLLDVQSIQNPLLRGILLFYFSIMLDIYMIFHIVFVLWNIKKYSVESLVLGVSSFLALLIPILIAVFVAESDETILVTIFQYSFSIITIVLSSHLLYKIQKHNT